jgi:hypothetical protein
MGKSAAILDLADETVPVDEFLDLATRYLAALAVIESLEVRVQHLTGVAFGDKCAPGSWVPDTAA